MYCVYLRKYAQLIGTCISISHITHKIIIYFITGNICIPGYTLDNSTSICYKISYEVSGSGHWPARTKCENDGAMLAPITTPERLAFYYNLIPGKVLESQLSIK